MAKLEQGALDSIGSAKAGLDKILSEQDMDPEAARKILRDVAQDINEADIELQ